MPDRTRRTGDLVSENNIFVDIANDRVGIGTTVPEYDLDIGGLENSIDPQNAGFGTVRIASHLGIGHSDLTATSAKPENTSYGGVLTLGSTSDTAKTAYIIFATNTGASNDFGSIAIGDYKNLKSGGATNNIAIGSKNLYSVQSGSNIAIGSQNLQDLTTTSNANIGIGYQTLNSVTTSSSYNIALGHRAGSIGSSNDVQNNIFIGRSAGYLSLSSFSKDNILIGRNSGYDGTATGRKRNIVIGNVPAAKVGDDQFAIGVDDGVGDYYWLVGDENKNIGIGTTNPTASVGVGNTAVLAVGIVSAYQLYVNGSPVSGSGGISSVFEDTTPQLGGTLDTNGNLIQFGDSSSATDDRLQFGAEQDLQIYHDGNNSYISDTGTGNLVISGGGYIELQNANLNEYYAKFISNGGVEFYFNNSKKFVTTGIGVSILNGTEDTATIAGPSNLIIDPGTVGDNTGIVRIKGDLFVDGTQTQINSTTIELADFVVGIATTATSDLLSDGAGIEIGPDNTFKYYYNSGTNPSLKSSENLNVASGKGYQIDQTEVLNATTLGTGVVNSSLTSVGTLGSLTVSGNISIADKIVHTGDTDTAIRFPDTDTFTVETAGSERLRISSGGQIGIGTTGTSALLTIQGNSNAVTAPSIRLLDGTDTREVSITNASGDFIVSTHGTDDAIHAQIKIIESGIIDFGTGGSAGTLTNRLRITSDGNIGIGQDNPQSKLQIENAGEQLRLTYPSIASYIHEVKSNGDYAIDKDGTEALRISSNGQVLIGTDTAPVGTDAQYAKFAVRGNTLNTNAAYLSLGNGKSTADTGNDDNLGIIVFNDDDSSDAGEYARIIGATDGANGTNDYPGKLIFLTTADGAASPTERLRITSGGNIGIGTISPSTKLHVSGGDLYVNSLDNSEVDIKLGVNATDSNFGVIKNVRASNSQNYLSFNIHNGSLYEALQIHYEGVNIRGNKEYNTTAYTGTSANAFFGDQERLFAEIVVESESASSPLGAFVFKTKGSGPGIQERLRIGSAGQIGLGGANYGTSGQVLTSNGSSSAPTWQDASGGGSSYWVQTDVGIHTLSSVGIGTTNPQSKLEINVGTAVSAFDIQGSAGQLFSVTNNLTSGSIFSVNDVTGIPSIDVDADGTIQLAPFGSTEYVGVGTTNPTQKLDVNGNVAIGGSIYDANGTAGSNGQVLSNVAGFGVSWTDQSSGGSSASAINDLSDAVTYNSGRSVGLGTGALINDDGTNDNTALGYKALNVNSSGSGMTGIGHSALAKAGDGSGNACTAVGYFALNSNTSGSDNTAVGYQALQSNVSSQRSTAIGYQSLENSTGSSNTGLGCFAGDNITSGSNLTCVGYNAEASSATATNEITLGDTNVTSLRIPGLQSGASDGDVLTYSSSSGNITLAAASGGYWVQTDVGIHTLSSVGIGTTNPEATLQVDVGTGTTAFDVLGSEGTLFSVTNNLTSGSIFSVNDVSGMPSIDVDADGTIQLAPSSTTENVGVGTTNPTSKLHVVGDTKVTGVITATSYHGDGSNLSGVGDITSSLFV